jgi:hypothetical protein
MSNSTANDDDLNFLEEMIQEKTEPPAGASGSTFA